MTKATAATCGKCKAWQETRQAKGMGFCKNDLAPAIQVAPNVPLACRFLPSSQACLVTG